MGKWEKEDSFKKMKRPESVSSSSSPTSSHSPAPSPPPPPPPPEGSGEDKKYRRRGGMLESIHRWSARNGKRVVACAVALVLSVFFIPPLKLMTSSWKSSSTRREQKLRAAIPLCPTLPWKTGENLQGKCPGDLKPNPEATNVSQCASLCCASEECISWQYRKDVGCLQGGDIRLGMEKDGPSAWCSDHPPYRWKGQRVKPREKGADAEAVRRNACDERTWNPDEEIGQCFGLGDVKIQASGSAGECMRACCGDEKCGAWQWNKELGCFYAGGMHACQGDGNLVAFEPFVGRRKRLEGRHYTDKHNKPWKMAME